MTCPHNPLTTSDSSTDSAHSGVCRGRCRDAQTRRSRLRNSGSFSHSLPASRAASTSPAADRNVPSSVSVDIDCALGAYHPHDCSEARCSHIPITASTLVLVPSASTNSRVPQSARSSAASSSVRTEFVARCASAVVPIEPRELPRPVLVGEPLQSQPGEPPDAEEEDDLEGDERRPIVSCSCEGACGCASRGLVAKRNVEPSIMMAASRALILRSNSTDDSPISKGRIIGLLGSSRSSSRNTAIGTQSIDSANCRSVFMDCSTPCGTFSKSFHKRNGARTLSICSKDNRVTKSSTISGRSSYERLHDEFDVVSEPTSILGPGTLANTPRTTPNRFMSLPLAATRHYSSCDLDSLCESIKALDSFLAQRDKTSQEQGAMRRRRPMTVMLFETPEQRTCSRSDDTSSTRSSSRRGSADSTTRLRVWRSTDDSLTN